VFSTPGALLRFGREGRLRAPLAGLLIAGTLPGVLVGAIVRVQWLSNSHDLTAVAPKTVSIVSTVTHEPGPAGSAP
jgi:hypothetical protein